MGAKKKKKRNRPFGRWGGAVLRRLLSSGVRCCGPWSMPGAVSPAEIAGKGG